MTYFEVVMHARIISIKNQYFKKKKQLSNNSNNRANINNAIDERVSFDWV